MVRFKLRTLLIATALFAVFLGLQVHVHIKAKRLIKEIRSTTELDQRILLTEVAPLSFVDIARFERRCEVQLVPLNFASNPDLSSFKISHIYRVPCFGEIDNENRDVFEHGLKIPSRRQGLQ